MYKHNPPASLMKRFPLFAFFPLIFVSTFAPANPRLFVAEPEINFGEARSGEVLEKEFILENRGNETLKIRDIKTSCGCTTPENKSMIIQAGEKKALKVVLDLKDKTGPQNQYITLSSNDPDNKSFSLKISGEAVPDILVTPRTLNLMQKDPDQPHEGEVLLSSTRGEAFDVTKVTANRDRVTAEVIPSADGQSARILVTPRPQKGQGHFTDVLEIDTSNPKVKQVRVLVMWQISTGLSVAPGQVNLILSDKVQILDRYLMVRGYPGLKVPLEVTGVEWPGQEVEILFTDTEKFGWRIHLKAFTPNPSMKDSEILIHTNAEGFETLKVPVRILEQN
jgi:hypothetical protein